MKVISYTRLSTKNQQAFGLGLDAQNHAVSEAVRLGNHELIASFHEVTSGAKNKRPELTKALELCKKTGAMLVIAKLDRLSRNASFVMALMESGVNFLCCDYPEADRFTIGVLALIAEKERQMISQRTKDALAAAKRRGTVLGNPRWQGAVAKMAQGRSDRATAFRASVVPVIRELRESGVNTLGEIAHCLNLRGFKTATGKSFLPQTVSGLA